MDLQNIRERREFIEHLNNSFIFYKKKQSQEYES